MLAQIKSRIGIKLALVFLAVLCLAMSAIVTFNAIYYEDFGQQVIAENELHVKEQAFTFLGELTQQRAQKYQAIFDKLAASSKLIARQVELRFQLANDPPKKLVSASRYLNIRPANGMYYTDLDKSVTVCYWGGATIPGAVEDELNILLPATAVLVETKEQNPEVIASHLIMTSGTGYYYPNSQMVYALPPVSELDLRDTNNYALADPRNNPERKTVWVPVYFDDVGNGLITTVTTPFFGKDGAFLGVAGMDVPLERIHSQILHGSPQEDELQRRGLLSFLLDSRGKIISFPFERLAQFGIKSNVAEFNNSFDLLERGLMDSSLAEVRALGEAIRIKPAKTSGLQLGGEPYVVSWQRLPANGWQLVTVIPQQVFLSPLQDLQQVLQEHLRILQRNSYLMAMLFFGSAAMVILLLQQRFFLQPLRQITLAAERVKEGDLKPMLPKGRTDEIGSLANSFSEMLVALRHAKELEQSYAQQLKRQVGEQTQQLSAQKSALEQSLDLLQQDILRRQQVEVELTAAKQAADAANDAKAQFLANITHELRTPLIGVLGMNELLAETSLAPAQQSLVTTAQSCGESLLSIINDVLDFSKIESGNFALDVREVEIGLLIEQTSALMVERAERKGLLLACRVEPSAMWLVMADAVRLRQILLNLLGNAVKFTAQGEILVRFGMVARAEGHGRFVLEVEDSGIGISEEVQGRIFAPFVQGDDSPTREFGGTGLGLAIVRQLVALMGGDLALESRTGTGSLFRVTLDLPLLAPHLPLLPEPLRGRRMLLQVGHPFVRETLRQMLEALDVRVVGVASGEEAWGECEAACRQENPFAMVLACAPTRLADGVLLIDRFQNDEQCKKPRIIGYCSRTCRLANACPPGLTLLEEPIRWQSLAEIMGADWQNGAPGGLEPPASVAVPPLFEVTDTGSAPRRLLIADDYAVTRELVRAFLIGHNVEIDQAASGAEVLAALQRHSYDLILMDCSMPELDGMETTRRLREQGHRVPIVALTAHIDSQIANACEAAGMDDFLSKPFRRRELLDMVEKWLNVAEV